MQEILGGKGAASHRRTAGIVRAGRAMAGASGGEEGGGGSWQDRSALWELRYTHPRHTPHGRLGLAGFASLPNLLVFSKIEAKISTGVRVGGVTCPRAHSNLTQ